VSNRDSQEFDLIASLQIENKPHDSNRPASLETPKIPKFKKKA
jgi:hypothetical protein